MNIKDIHLEPIEILDRICDVYGFTQKIQLANYLDISASSLQNRYTRGTISYDYAAICSLDTGASLKWLLTGEGAKFEHDTSTKTLIEHKEFTLSEGKLQANGFLSIDPHLFPKQLVDGIAVRTGGRLHFVDKAASLADGSWLVDIEGAISIRELTVLPGKRLHVAGGKVPFECGIDEIKTIGRVVGVYSEVN
ncbi:helix-turn-helix domain-containing protein [Serratia marcescens]|uniref:phage repressor protein CI n=1 Tax=Serratia marcescens TaxID=615 RepID=UPI0025817C4F|nr:phage repressor protein CI [Serratia marcescens]MDM1777903.1 helix-turn-helix domain-containing protein [Serratia marcescens]